MMKTLGVLSAARRLLLAAAATLLLAAPTMAQDHDHGHGGPPSGGHWGGPNGWEAHPGFRGDIGHFDMETWRGGHWWHGTYGGRLGFWWIVGPNWYWYPTQVAEVPDPYTPPGAVSGWWYYCPSYGQYYPYVGACPTGWQAVQPH